MKLKIRGKGVVSTPDMPVTKKLDLAWEEAKAYARSRGWDTVNTAAMLVGLNQVDCDAQRVLTPLDVQGLAGSLSLDPTAEDQPPEPSASA